MHARAAAFLVATCGLLLAGGALDPGARAQQLGREVWPSDWFGDLPAVDMTGTWLFDGADSDPMPEAWAGHEVKYIINQQAAFIVLEFLVPDVHANTQRYTWDGLVERSQRQGWEFEEAVRWTDAGRMLEVLVRRWEASAPEVRDEYRFTYRVRGDQLTFVQEYDTRTTVWRFSRQRVPGGAGD